MKIGTTTNRDPVHIPHHDRDKHLYVIGQTGTGKSTLIENCIAHDLEAGEGVVLIDPHGVLSENVVRHIPRSRDDDLIYLKPAYLPSPVSFNPLHGVHTDDRGTVAGNIVGAFVDFFGERAVADRSQQVLRNSLLALMEHPDTTLLSVMRLLTDPKYRHDVVLSVTDPIVRFYWTHQFDAYSDQKRDDVISPILNKLDALFAYPAIRHMLAQPGRSVNLARLINERKILIVNLSGLAEGADSVFGALMVSSIWSAMRQAEGKTPLYLYIDEFPHFTTHTIVPILSEARKFKLSLTIGHQFWGQVDADIRSAVLGNVGTQISFRVGVEDAPIVAKQFERSERQVLDLPNYTAYIRPVPPAGSVRFETCPPRNPVRESGEGLIANSFAHFGADRETVEQQIRDFFDH
jgi:hypothetical protein